MVGCKGEPLNLLLEDMEKVWELQCGVSSLGAFKDHLQGHLQMPILLVPGCFPSLFPAICGYFHDFPGAQAPCTQILGQPRGPGECSLLLFQLASCSCAVSMHSAPASGWRSLFLSPSLWSTEVSHLPRKQGRRKRQQRGCVWVPLAASSHPFPH